MRSTLRLEVVGAGTALVVAAWGCGGGGQTGTGGGGAGGAPTTSSTTASSSSTSTTSSSGSTGGGGNHSFDSAEMLPTGGAIDGDLAKGVADYYVIDGTAGQALDIFVRAQDAASGAAFDPTYIDSVLTLYDASKKQIAENNDAIPRRSGDSEIITILPADGTYYLRVEECWTWAKDPKTTCLGTADKDSTSYTIGMVTLDPSVPGSVGDGEKGNDAASATPVTFAKKNGGGYYLSVLYGTYQDAADVDVYSFTLPADAVTLPANTRGIVSLWVLPAGQDNDGSTTPAGKVRLVDPADLTKDVAYLAGTDFQGPPRLWPPIDLAKEYLLFVEHPGTPAGANDFYVALQGEGSSNPLEKDEAGNDSPATAEVPTDAPDSAGAHHYFIDGDLINGAADVDHWKVPVDATKQVAVSCGAQRAGSGVRGFRIDVLDAATMNAVTTVTESATSDGWTGYVNIPVGVTDLVVKLSAASQDPTVTSSFYHCGIHLR
jgi:hypothetical protein